RTEIKALHQRLGTTTIYVTHDQIEALTMADRIVLLRDGRIEQIGTPTELYERPGNLFVAEFIGSPATNLLSGVLDREVDRLLAVTAEDLRVPLPQRALGESGRGLTIGLRPEHISLRTDGPGWPAKVDLVEPMGAQTQILCTAGKQRLTILSAERALPSVGSRVILNPDFSMIHIFDSATGHRL